MTNSDRLQGFKSTLAELDAIRMYYKVSSPTFANEMEKANIVPVVRALVEVAEAAREFDSIYCPTEEDEKNLKTALHALDKALEAGR